VHYVPFLITIYLDDLILIPNSAAGVYPHFLLSENPKKNLLEKMTKTNSATRSRRTKTRRCGFLLFGDSFLPRPTPWRLASSFIYLFYFYLIYYLIIFCLLFFFVAGEPAIIGLSLAEVLLIRNYIGLWKLAFVWG